jgi:hypothetical protein
MRSMTAAALIVPGPPRNPVRLSDGRLVVVHVVDFYAKPSRESDGK